MAPTRGNGKIFDLGIPAADVARSVRFDPSVFGGRTRKRGLRTAVDASVAAGGRTAGADAPERTARFADPDGWES